MEPGYLLDRGDLNVFLKPHWVKGEPEKSYVAGFKIMDRDLHPVATYRCEQCGYLESWCVP